MAGAYQHGRGFLKIRTVFLLAAAALLSAAALLWFFQAAVFTSMLRRSGRGFYAESGSGTLFSGLTFYNVKADLPALHFAALELYFRADPAAVLTGRFVLAEVKAVRPSATIKKRPGAAGAAPPAAPFPIRLIELSSGSVSYGDLTLSVPVCSLSVSGNTFRIISCRAEYDRVSASFSGKYAGHKASLKGSAAYPSRRIRASFTYDMLDESQDIAARGTASGAPFALTAKVTGRDWNAVLRLKEKLPLDSIRSSLSPIPVASAYISASGRFLPAGGIRASGTFSADAGSSGRADGAFGLAPGRSSLKAAFSYRGLSGDAAAETRNGVLTGGVRASGSGAFRLPSGDELAFRYAAASCSLAGKPASPGAGCEVRADGLSLGRFAAEAAAATGDLEAGRPQKFGIAVLLSTPSFNGIRLDSASVDGGGTAAAGQFRAGAFYRGDAVRLAGAYSFMNSAARLTLDTLSISRVPDWRLCSPAALEYEKGKASVPGLCFASPGGRIEISGVFAAPFPETLHISVSGFDLSELSRAGVPRRLGGVLDLSADYNAAAPNGGAFSVKGEKLRLEDLDLGSFAAHGGFGPGRIVLEDSLWRLYGGTAKASGRAFFPARTGITDVSVIASSMNAAPLLALVPGVSAGEVWINGEDRLQIDGDTIRNSGNLRLSSPALTVGKLGLKFADAAVLVESGGPSALYLSASARGKKDEMVTVSGPLSAAGPALRIRTRRFSIDHPAGLTGQVNADLLFSGTWKEPELAGKLELRKAVFELEKWRKFRPPQGERSDYYGRLSLDLEVAAERNIWYRDGPSSIELKGRVLVKKDHYRPAALIGSIEAVKGYYIYLGNSFTVQSARLTFNGEYPPNPAVDVTAAIEERGRPLKIYFNVTGTARDPQVALTSDPPMDQRDIMSFLVTGRPLYQSELAPGASQPGPAAGSVTAQNIAAGFLSQQASTAFGRKLDLDVLNVRVNAENMPDVTLGRYITRELFISYGQALGQGGERRVSAEYTLTRHLSLVGNNSSEGRYGADFLFKYGIK